MVESMGDSNVGAVESCRGWCWEVVVQFIQQFTSRTIKPPELICFCFAPSHVAQVLLSYKRNCFCVCFPTSQEHIMPAIPDKNGKMRSPSCDHCWIKDDNIYIGQWIHFRLSLFNSCVSWHIFNGGSYNISFNFYFRLINMPFVFHIIVRCDLKCIYYYQKHFQRSQNILLDIS